MRSSEGRARDREGEGNIGERKLTETLDNVGGVVVTA